MGVWGGVFPLREYGDDDDDNIKCTRFVADPTMCLSFQMIVDFFLVELRMTEFSEEEIR